MMGKGNINPVDCAAFKALPKSVVRIGPLDLMLVRERLQFPEITRHQGRGQVESMARLRPSEAAIAIAGKTTNGRWFFLTD
jgi:hypothetical protein